jgi:hypothetical protein
MKNRSTIRRGRISFDIAASVRWEKRKGKSENTRVRYE